MVKQIVVMSTQWKLLRSERTIDTCNNLGRNSDMMLSKRSQSQKVTYPATPIYLTSGKAQTIVTEQRSAVNRLGEGEERGEARATQKNNIQEFFELVEMFHILMVLLVTRSVHVEKCIPLYTQKKSLYSTLIFQK